MLLLQVIIYQIISYYRNLLHNKLSIINYNLLYSKLLTITYYIVNY